MNLRRITRLSSARRLTSHPLYRAAKAGSLGEARRLVADIIPDIDRFAHLSGYVCPVLKNSGNRIPLALAEFMCHHSGLQLYDAIRLRPLAHGSAMIERLYYQPEFSGPVAPGSYIIVDDVYTSGSTIQSLVRYIEAGGAEVKGAFVIGSSKSTLLSPRREQVRTLLPRFPEVERYFDLEDLTDPQIRYMMRFNSLGSINERYYRFCLERFYGMSG